MVYFLPCGGKIIYSYIKNMIKAICAGLLVIKASTLTWGGNSGHMDAKPCLLQTHSVGLPPPAPLGISKPLPWVCTHCETWTCRRRHWHIRHHSCILGMIHSPASVVFCIEMKVLLSSNVLASSFSLADVLRVHHRYFFTSPLMVSLSSIWSGWPSTVWFWDGGSGMLQH